jgi:hypothetical protein
MFGAEGFGSVCGLILAFAWKKYITRDVGFIE